MRFLWSLALVFGCQLLSETTAGDSIGSGIDNAETSEKSTTKSNIRGGATGSRRLDHLIWSCDNGWYYLENGQWMFWGYNNDCPDPNRISNFVKVPTDTLSLVGDNGSPSYQFPLAKCEGDCDSDNDCMDNLVCSKRSGYTSIPGCKGIGVYGKDYCTEVTTSSQISTDTLTIVGNNGSPSYAFPLGKCQGDCDHDGECKGNLVCFKRSGTESIPGCQGSGISGKDYCAELYVDQQVTNVVDDGSFMIRLFWDTSYFWQDSSSEAWWCLECTSCNEYGLLDGWEYGCKSVGYDGRSCRAGDAVWIRNCKDTNRQFRWNIIKNDGSGDQIQAAGSNNLCLSILGNRFVQLQPCNKNNSRQLFKRIEDINQFEIRPYHQRHWLRSDAMCLSQLHHPKDKEMVGLHNCQEANDHETVFWEDYYQ